jgi:phosphate transport system protein
MPRINFQQQLVALKDKLLAMAALSQQALSLSLEAYYDLLAKEQPMAIDLRFILSVIKINGDLERIGDQAMNIAERAQYLHDSPQISLPIDIPDMGEKVGVMIRKAIQSLLEADAKLADSVLAMDDEIDDMNRDVQLELMEVMQQHPVVSGQALNAIIIARNLERAADHATNIAEDVIFWVRGSDVRHKMSLAEAD